MALQDKLLVSTMLLLAAALLGSGAAFAWYSADQVRRLVQREGEHAAAAAAVAVVPAMASGDLEAMSALARGMLQPPDVTSFAIYDADGRGIVGWRKSGHGAIGRFAPTPLSDSSVSLDSAGDVDGELEALLPITDSRARGSGVPGGSADTIGYISVRITDAPVLEYAQRTMQVASGGGMAILAIVLPLVFLLVHRAFAPLRKLSVAARNVAEGHFETVDIKRGDTLGLLADTFNHMVLRLAEQKGRADEAHARLIEANLDLERRIAERTSAIEAASRRLSAEIAEKEDFLRAVSHDLNAPLRNIEGMVTMLLRKHGDQLPEEVQHRLDRIKKNVEHETGLINDLLELSRIKTRREASEHVNLEELLWELRGLLENDLRERNIDLVIETALPTLYAEKSRVRQIFQNLIDNAIKYMGDSLERRVCVGANPGVSETEFWVRDTGQGIAPEDCGKIFYIFRRGRAQQHVAGKGVGLASVKSIVENYHGRIWVESELGRGSTFRFTINGQYVVPEAAGPRSARAA